MTLERKTPLKRGGELQRRPMGRAGTRPRTKRPRARDTGPTPATTELVLARAGGRCEVCRGTLDGPGGYSKHHRHPRRMGGSRRPELNTAANLVVLCGSGTTGCHGRVESNRVQAYADGLLLHDGQDPAVVPVLLACNVDGWPRMVLLTVDGTYGDPTTDETR